MPLDKDVTKMLNDKSGSFVKYEFTRDYNGSYGSWPAQIFANDHVSFAFDIIEKGGISKEDYLSSNLGVRGGTRQIILKTNEAVDKFVDTLKKMVDEKGFSLQSHMRLGSARTMFK